MEGVGSIFFEWGVNPGESRSRTPPSLRCSNSIADPWLEKL